MKYAMGFLLFSTSLLFSSATSDEKTLDKKTKLQMLKNMSAIDPSFSDDVKSVNEAQLKRLRSMSGGSLDQQNPYKLRLNSSKKKTRTVWPKNNIGRCNACSLLKDDCGAGHLLKYSGDERIESQRFKGGGLNLVVSLKRTNELLQREKEKKAFEKNLTKGELHLYGLLGYSDFVYAAKFDGLIQLLKKNISNKAEGYELKEIYTLFLREQLASLKKPTQLIKVASVSQKQENSPRSRSVANILLNINKTLSTQFIAHRSFPVEDQKQLYKILGSAEFEYVKKARGILPVLLEQVQGQACPAKIWASYTGYLRHKINNREKSCDIINDDKSPRNDSPRTVKLIINEASKQPSYSPRKQDAPHQLVHATKKISMRLFKARQKTDGALTKVVLVDTSKKK